MSERVRKSNCKVSPAETLRDKILNYQFSTLHLFSYPVLVIQTFKTNCL